MSQKKYIIIGAGSRGSMYANYFLSNAQSGKIIAVAEPRKYYLNKMAREHHICEQDNITEDWSRLARKPKFADAVIIATPDARHCEPAIAFAKKGYHILLEKPLAPNERDCERIVQAAIDNKIIFCVSHVLRYTAYTQKLKQIINSGLIGQIVSIQHLEPVGYWHQAHTFVRGNSRNTALQSFMLLQKSCHDFDWLRYIVGKRCSSVSSFGSLMHFTAKNKPTNASDRCTKCQIEQNCPYSAVKIYLRDRANLGKFFWPVDMLSSDLTIDGIRKSLEECPYGRCVYACDNNVVDHQVANLLFENNITVAFTMTGFCKQSDRKTRIFGTHGQLEGDGEVITHYDFLTDKTITFDVSQSDGSILSGHGGGDYNLMKHFTQAVALNDESLILSGPQETLETHKMVFAAERSRLEKCIISL